MTTLLSRLSYLAVSLGLATLTLAARAEDSRHFVTDPATGAVSMQVGGKTCWTYVPQSKEGKPYFHPLTIPGTSAGPAAPALSISTRSAITALAVGCGPAPRP